MYAQLQRGLCTSSSCSYAFLKVYLTTAVFLVPMALAHSIGAWYYASHHDYRPDVCAMLNQQLPATNSSVKGHLPT